MDLLSGLSALDIPLISRWAFLGFFIVIIFFLSRMVEKALVRSVHENSNLYRAKKLNRFLTYLLVFLVVTIAFSETFRGLTIFFGVAGAGIAFSLQEVIVSFAGWLAVMFGGFYKTGDRVQLGGIKGDVMDIGLLRTTVMELGQWVDGDLYNGRVVLIANSFVFKEPVFNYSGDFPFLWDELKIPIKYGSDYHKTESLLLKVCREDVGDLSNESRLQWKVLQQRYRLEDAQTDPMVFINANDNWVEFTLRYVVDYKLRRSTKNSLFYRILEEIDKTGGSVAIASATVDIVGLPELRTAEGGSQDKHQA